MSARVNVTSELLDQLFRLPDGVTISRMDRIPTSTGPGRFLWRMYLTGDGLLIDGEATLDYKLETASTEIRAVVQPAEVDAMSVAEYRRRRGDAGGEAVSTS